MLTLIGLDTPKSPKFCLTLNFSFNQSANQIGIFYLGICIAVGYQTISSRALTVKTYITLKPTVTALFFCKGKNSVKSRPMEVWFLSFLVAFVSICERQQQLIFCSLSFPSSTSTLPRALHNEGDQLKRGAGTAAGALSYLVFPSTTVSAGRGRVGQMWRLFLREQ